jgi:hypothetical protein
MAVLWALASIPLGLISVVVMTYAIQEIPSRGTVMSLIGFSSLFGAASGLVFGALVALSERRRTLETLSRGRFARWGIVAAILPPAVQIAWYLFQFPMPWNTSLSMLLPVVVLNGLFGAACAAGILYFARRARPAITDPEPAKLPGT